MKHLIRRSPFSGFSELQQVFDQLLSPSGYEQDNVVTNWVPHIDIKDDKDQYLIKADLPGVDPKDIDVHIENGVLTIKGTKESEKKEEKENYVHYERNQGSFFRSIRLPNAADSTQIKAKSKNGVLEISVPKSSKALAKKIEVTEE